MTERINSYREFKETYIPLHAKAEKAIKMTKKEFCSWFLNLPKGEQDQVKRIMLQEAGILHRKADHIHDLLGY